MDPKFVSDGFLSLEGGVDAGRPPSILDENQCARAINGTFRGGYFKCRPRAKRLSFTTDDFTTTALEIDLFQGAGAYVDDDGNGAVLLSLNGHIYRFELDSPDPQGTRLSSNTVLNSPVLEKAWFCQGESYCIIQDGQSRALVWDGLSLTRTGDGQIPVGTRMTYGLGRLWVAQGRAYYGGDLVDSDPEKGRKSILYFTENEFLTEGGAFAVPTQSGEITGLAFTAQPDTASGEGSLMITTRTGIYQFAAPVDRDVWRVLEQPLQRNALLNFGATSHESIAVVNGDLFFMAEDGVRSFYFARRDFGGFGNTPVSGEVSKAVPGQDKELLSYASAVNFDNRLIMTAEPRRTLRGTVHGRMVVLDFHLVSNMRTKLAPAWDGEWTFDFEPFQILTVDTRKGRRCIIVGIDENDLIGLWELLPDGRVDYGSDSPVMELHSRSFVFQSPTTKKRLQHAEFWLGNVRGAAINVDGWYKSDPSDCWVPWARYTGTGQTCMSTPGIAACSIPTLTREANNPRVGFPPAPSSVDEDKCEDRRDGYEFQVRLKFSAPCVLQKLKVRAEVLDQNTNPKVSQTCVTLSEDCSTC